MTKYRSSTVCSSRFGQARLTSDFKLRDFGNNTPGASFHSGSIARFTARISSMPSRPYSSCKQLLLDRIASDAVLGERRAAQPNHLAAERENRLLARLDVGHRSRDDVRDAGCRPRCVPTRRRPDRGAGTRRRRSRSSSSNRSNGTIMSAAVFSMRGSIACFARPTRAFTAGGHRLAQRQQLRRPRAIAGHGDLHVVEHAGLVQHPAEADQRRVRRARFARAADLVERLRRGRRRAAARASPAAPSPRRPESLTPCSAIDAVLSQQRQAPRVHVLDRRDVQPARIVRPPRLARRVAQPPHQRERRRAIRERHEREADRRPHRQHPQRDFGDDAERAFGIR